MGWRQNTADLWYTFFHLAVLLLEGVKHTYIHGENSFWGFSDPSGGPLGPPLFFTSEMLDFDQVSVFAYCRPVFGWKFLKPSPGGLQVPLSLPIEEKNFFVDVWPQINRELVKILDGSDFARERGKVILSRAQKFKNNICSWVLGDEYLG